jgi:hypothetical protein
MDEPFPDDVFVKRMVSPKQTEVVELKDAVG